MKRQLGRGHGVAAARFKFTRALASLLLLPACAVFGACGAGRRIEAVAVGHSPGGVAGAAALRPYSTWQSLGEPLLPGSGPGATEGTHPGATGADLAGTAPAADLGGPALGGFPVGGIASHHLLAHAWIDAWFAALARARTVETFFIVSPRHFGQSGGVASMSLRPFAVSGGLVELDVEAARRVAGQLEASFEDTAFTYEHGVSTFAPFIARHFPAARVVPLAVDGEPPVDLAGARALAAALLPEFRGGAERRAFLLVSSDFSHHGTKAEADRRDAISRRFVERPSAASWFFAGCDNRPGMYVLGALADELGAEGRVLWRTTSIDIAPGHVDPRDVTSYFFSFAALAAP